MCTVNVKMNGIWKWFYAFDWKANQNCTIGQIQLTLLFDVHHFHNNINIITYLYPRNPWFKRSLFRYSSQSSIIIIQSIYSHRSRNGNSSPIQNLLFTNAPDYAVRSLCQLSVASSHRTTSNAKSHEFIIQWMKIHWHNGNRLWAIALNVITLSMQCITTRQKYSKTLPNRIFIQNSHWNGFKMPIAGYSLINGLTVHMLISSC